MNSTTICTRFVLVLAPLVLAVLGATSSALACVVGTGTSASCTEAALAVSAGWGRLHQLRRPARDRGHHRDSERWPGRLRGRHRPAVVCTRRPGEGAHAAGAGQRDRRRGLRDNGGLPRRTDAGAVVGRLPQRSPPSTAAWMP